MKELSSHYLEITKSGLFSADWYLDQYQDVAAAGQDPLEHYLLYGADEGRDPGPGFSTTGYLSRYHDVADASINPLLHYIRYGKNEGRLTYPCFDPRSIKRPYRNFGEYLTYSILDPLVKAPFGVVDLDSFTFMDQIAHWLCLKQKDCAEPPLVSVIMPMLDRSDVVGDAVRSVLEQSYENFELIVIDDGSRDKSVSVVKAFTDSRILLLANNKSSGVSAARNRGLAVASGKFIAYLDSDNTWRPDYLCAMVGVFQVRSDADAAYSGQYLYQGYEREPFAVRFGSYNPSLLRNHNYIDLNCFVHRRNIFKKIGFGFCEDIRRWVDWELILRIARVGRIYSVPILQSNYFMDKAENTITVTEELEPARRYIMNKVGYDSKWGLQKCEDQLTEKVAIIVLADGDHKNMGAFIGAMTDQSHNPLVQILVVSNTLDDLTASRFRELETTRVKTIVIEPDCEILSAIDQASRMADPGSDLLVIDPTAMLTSGTLVTLQKTAYTCDSIAVTVPQHVLPGGEPMINTHVPYAFNDVPCDIALSNQHRNIEPLALFHCGGDIDLNFTSFFCVYIKRDAWDLCGGFGAKHGKDHRSGRIICDFVRHVLERRIVYTPEAIVLQRTPTVK